MYFTEDEMKRLPLTRQRHWYNPETGYLHEIEPTLDRDGNTIYMVAPHPCHYLCNGYPVITWNRQSMQLSHAVWAWHHGPHNVRRLRHLDGNKLNTRIENLAKSAARMHRAQIWAGGRNHYIGMYPSKAEARAAENQARAIFGLAPVTQIERNRVYAKDLWERG